MKTLYVRTTWVILGFVLAGVSSAAGQAPLAVPSLYSTGVAVSGGLLPEGSPDPHYSLVDQPVGAMYPLQPSVAITNLSPLFGGEWFANGPDSQWVVPGNGVAGHCPAGQYTYRTTFDLTGFDPRSTSVRMRLAADNAVEVYLNGAPTGVESSEQQGYFTFTGWHTINAGFGAGVNTFDFVVTNVGTSTAPPGPSGFRVEMHGTAVPVPEPAAMSLLAGGTVAGFAVRGRWRRRQRGS